MALQIDLQTSNFGIPFTGAYFRIVTASVSRQRAETVRHIVMIDVVGYAAKPLTEDTKEVDFRRYHAPLVDIEAQVGTSFLEKCYNWVAQQADMTDCVAV